METRDRIRQAFYHRLMPEPGLECHGLFSSFLAFIQYQAEKYLFVFVLHGFQVSKLNILCKKSIIDFYDYTRMCILLS